MPSTCVYLALGSNIGDREANLRAAIAALDPAGVRVNQVSTFYETEPVDFLEQPWFLNCALKGETKLAPMDLLRALRGIEAQMGNEKPVPKGPRLIDIDILLYGDETVDAPELRVPHPRMTARRFVLAPLAEIAPDLRHPSWKGSVGELLAQTRDRSEVRRLESTA